MPVIMKDNVQYAYTTKGTVFHTLSNAEYEALPESEKMNGDVYCIPDREPILNPDEVWAKIGTGTLDIGDDLTDGVNQLNSSLEYKTASNFYYLDISQPYTTIPNLSSYRNGICYVKSSSLSKWFGVPFDVANIVDTGLASQIYVTSNLYIRDFVVVKASNRIEYDGVNGISDCFVCLYR